MPLQREDMLSNSGGTSQRDDPRSLPSSPVATTLDYDNLSLCEALREQGNYWEVDDGPRLAALAHLEEIISQWCTLIRMRERGIPQSYSATAFDNSNGDVDNVSQEHAQVALTTFGSHRLRVHGWHSDIDVVAISPPYCKREDFYSSLVALLNQSNRVSHVNPITSAFTPVIKFTLNGIHVDLLFARLSDSSKLIAYQRRKSAIVTSTGLVQRDEFMIEDSDLIGMDEACIRSINGARFAQLLIKAVPNLESFRITLRAVKEWANARGIYSNVLGFLGGVNCAIMVAWVCQQHPQETPASLLKHFFETFLFWQWPSPVVLSPIALVPPPGVAQLPVWNPATNPRDKLHIMPIITPTYPSMNSSYNVARPQLLRIQEELSRAIQSLCAAENLGFTNWKKIFCGTDFFYQHIHFLHISITASNADYYVPWFRFCESKLRYLISRLDAPDVIAFPFAKFFERRYNSNGRCLGSGRSDDNCLHESCFFMGLRFAAGVEKVDLTLYTADFLQLVNNWEGRRRGMDLSMAHVVFQDLPSYVFEDQNCRGSPSRQATANSKTSNDGETTKERATTGPSSPQQASVVGAGLSLAPVYIVTSPSKRLRKTV